MAAPEETQTTQPLDLRRAGMTSLSWGVLVHRMIDVREGAYEAEGAEDVDVVVLLPVVDGGVGEALEGVEDAVVHDHAVELAEGLDGECRYLASRLRLLAPFNKAT